MRHRRQQGFTLIEALVALTIFVIAITLIVPAFTSFLTLNSSSERQGQAVRAGQQVLDQLRTEDVNRMETSGSRAAQTVTVGGHPFKVVVSFCVTSVYCSTGPTSGSRDVAVEVSDNGKVLFSAETVYTKLYQTSN